MKIFTLLDNKKDIAYYKQNGMYQTAIKYMNMLKENGRFECFNSWYEHFNVMESRISATVVAFHEVYNDEDFMIAKIIHRFNARYSRLPYNTDKDVALVVRDDSRDGEVSFIFHENGAGIYDEIRFLDGIRYPRSRCIQIDEI